MKRIGLCLLMIFLLACKLPSQDNTDNQNSISGRIEVPENRSKKDSRKIQLTYLVLKAKNQNSQKAPILYLQGGPGGATLFMEQYFENHPFREEHDIVLMDQRGTGVSEAICTNMGNEMIKILSLNLTPEEEVKLLIEATEQCKEEVKEGKVDVSGYNSRENAADLEDLRKHLGYEKWNLFGGSYGSRLGLTYMRDFPNKTRSAILFGVFAPESNLYANLVTNFKKSLYNVFDDCENDSDCRNRYPNLKNRLSAILKKIKAEPIQIKYKGDAFTINPQDALLMLHQMLYSRRTIAMIPPFIEALENKNSNIIRNALIPVDNVLNLINGAMYMSVNAYEELPFNGTTALLADIKNNPEFSYAPAFFASDPKSLEVWHPYRAQAVENAPIISDVPTLMANGRYDPVTPTSNAITAVKSLSNGFFIEFKYDSHSLLNSCFIEMCLEFLKTPEKRPDFSCVDKQSTINWN